MVFCVPSWRHISFLWPGEFNLFLLYIIVLLHVYLSLKDKLFIFMFPIMYNVFNIACVFLKLVFLKTVFLNLFMLIHIALLNSFSLLYSISFYDCIHSLINGHWLFPLFCITDNASIHILGHIQSISIILANRYVMLKSKMR